MVFLSSVSHRLFSVWLWQTSTSVSTRWTASTACVWTCPAATCATARQTSSSTRPESAVSVRPTLSAHYCPCTAISVKLKSRNPLPLGQTRVWETVSWTLWTAATAGSPAALRSEWAWPARPAAARWAGPGETHVNSALPSTPVRTTLHLLNYLLYVLICINYIHFTIL